MARAIFIYNLPSPTPPRKKKNGSDEMGSNWSGQVKEVVIAKLNVVRVKLTDIYDSKILLAIKCYHFFSLSRCIALTELKNKMKHTKEASAVYTA